MPKALVQTLHRAFDANMKDPAFLTDAKKRQFNVVVMSGEELTAILKRLYQTPNEAVRLTARAVDRIKKQGHGSGALNRR